VPLTTGRIDGCSWSVVTHRIDDEIVDGFLAYLEDLEREVREGDVVFDILYEVTMPTALQRKRLVTALRRAESRFDVIAGHAVVSSSVVGRQLLTAVNWLVRPTFVERVFKNPEAAFTWLATRAPGLDLDEVRQDIATKAPESSRLRW